METLKVNIENWQQSPWYIEWIPLLVGVIALCVSLYSLYLTREQFRLSARPYIDAANFWDLDAKIQINECFIFSVINAPTKVLKMELKLYYKDQITHIIQHNLVRFPVDGSTWAYRFGAADFNKYLTMSNGDEANFFRSVSFEYTALGGGKVYKSEVIQNFTGDGATWQNVSQNAN